MKQQVLKELLGVLEQPQEDDVVGQAIYELQVDTAMELLGMDASRSTLATLKYAIGILERATACVLSGLSLKMSELVDVLLEGQDGKPDDDEPLQESIPPVGTGTGAVRHPDPAEPSSC